MGAADGLGMTPAYEYFRDRRRHRRHRYGARRRAEAFVQTALRRLRPRSWSPPAWRAGAAGGPGSRGQSRGACSSPGSTSASMFTTWRASWLGGSSSGCLTTPRRPAASACGCIPSFTARKWTRPGIGWDAVGQGSHHASRLHCWPADKGFGTRDSCSTYSVSKMRQDRDFRRAPAYHRDEDFTGPHSSIRHLNYQSAKLDPLCRKVAPCLLSSLRGHGTSRRRFGSR